MMRIAVDAMGGDYAPREIVRGAVDAVRGLPNVDEIVLVGDEKAIRDEMAAYDVKGDLPKVRIVHTTQVIEMGEHPVQAVRGKPDSSINKGVALVKAKEVDAFVSAGSTGAMVAASLLGLRRIWGVKRPAIATVLPTLGRPLLMLDAGATTDCTEVELQQFAMMGSLYSKAVLKQKDPVVGLMSIGGEELKGNDITKKTFECLKNDPSLNFRGNVEGHDLFKGETDVVVCDGFVGNVILKTTESIARTIVKWIKAEFKQTWLRIFGCLFLIGAFKSLKKKLDPEVYGGAPLLGVNGTIIITHGASTKKAIFHAIRASAEAVNAHINESISAEMEKQAKAAK